MNLPMLRFPLIVFLSSSTPGYALILSLVLLSSSLNIHVFEAEAVPLEAIAREFWIFIFLLFFVLATPLGVILNGMSWFLLGRVTIFIENCLVWSMKKKWGVCLSETLYETASDARYRGKSGILNFFNIDGSSFQDWTVVTRKLTRVLKVYYPSLNTPGEQVDGIAIAARGLALVSIIVGAAFATKLGIFLTICATIIIPGCLLLFSAAVGVYSMLIVLHTVYIMATAKGFSTGTDVDRIVRMLARGR